MDTIFCQHHPPHLPLSCYPHKPDLGLESFSKPSNFWINCFFSPFRDEQMHSFLALPRNNLPFGLVGILLKYQLRVRPLVKSPPAEWVSQFQSVPASAGDSTSAVQTLSWPTLLWWNPFLCTARGNHSNSCNSVMRKHLPVLLAICYFGKYASSFLGN